MAASRSSSAARSIVGNTPHAAHAAAPVPAPASSSARGANPGRHAADSCSARCAAAQVAGMRDAA